MPSASARLKYLGTVTKLEQWNFLRILYGNIGEGGVSDYGTQGMTAKTRSQHVPSQLNNLEVDKEELCMQGTANPIRPSHMSDDRSGGQLPCLQVPSQVSTTAETAEAAKANNGPLRSPLPA
jgi:hypothetical protein